MERIDFKALVDKLVTEHILSFIEITKKRKRATGQDPSSARTPSTKAARTYSKKEY